MSIIEEIKARLLDSIALCDDELRNENIDVLDCEYVEGQKDAFKHVLWFIQNE